MTEVVLVTGGFFSSATAAMASIWLLLWGIRRQGELDYELDNPMKTIRWVAVALGLFISFVCGPGFNSVWCAAVGWICATAFLAWPNLAYHVARLLRRLKLLRNPSVVEPS